MNSFCVGFLAVLTVFSGQVLSRSTPDKLEQLLQAHAPFPQMLAEVFDDDPAVQMQHLQTLQTHIDKNDEYAPHAASLKTAAEAAIRIILNDIGYKGDNVDLEEFLEASQKVASGEHIDNPDLERAIQEFLNRKKQLSEASEDEKNGTLGDLASKAMGGNHPQEGHCQHQVQADVQEKVEEEVAPIRRSAKVSAAQSSSEDDIIDN